MPLHRFTLRNRRKELHASASAEATVGKPSQDLLVPQLCTTLWCMNKTEVYSWRVSPALKAALERAAREERASLAVLLERIVREWLARSPADESDEMDQKRRHAASLKFIGSVRGGHAGRSAHVRSGVRARLARRAR